MQTPHQWTHSVGIGLVLSVFMGCATGTDTPESAPDSASDRGGVWAPKADDGREADAPCGDFPSYYMEFLDDILCRKALPSNRDRELSCPVEASSATVYSPHQDKMVEYVPASAYPQVDDEALVGIVPDDLYVTLVLVRRVNGEPHYRYLSNGTHHLTFEPWSTTKFMAVANAGAHLREQSDGLVGLTGQVDGIPLGDLSTIVHNYDERTYRSNDLARWFLNVGDRDRLDGALHADWLARPAWETLGGNYGPGGAKLGYEIVDEAASVTVPGTDISGRRNRLSTFTITEFLKRLVMHREDPQWAMPKLTWDDVKVLLYGARESLSYGSKTPQGMESDTAIYLQAGLDMNQVETRAHGQWRIFSKLGFGTVRGGEFVNVGYACLPVFDEQGSPKLDWGKEFFLTTQVSGEGDFRATDKRLAEIYGQIVRAIMSGSLK